VIEFRVVGGRGLEPELHRIRKKFGIENNGLCLLISWTAELISRRAWSEDPPVEGEGEQF